MKHVFKKDIPEFSLLEFTGLINIVAVYFADLILFSGFHWSQLILFVAHLGVFFLLCRHRLWILCIVFFILSITIVVITQNYITPILLVIAASFLPLYVSLMTAMMIVASLFFVLVTCFYILDLESYLIVAMALYSGFALFSVSSSYLREQAILLKNQLQETNFELQTTKTMLSQSIRQNERSRIAQNMHDSVGNRLTVLSLSLENIIVGKHEIKADYIKNIKQQVDETLQDIRRIVSTMREPEKRKIKEIIEDMLNYLPDYIDVQYSIAQQNLSPRLEQNLVYCIKEGISNALRHGKADKIFITLSFGQKCLLSVDDNGQYKNNLTFKNGLCGMQARMQPYKGQVKILTSDKLGGTSMQLTFQADVANE